MDTTATVQRALVLALGDEAATAATFLREHLEQPGQPAAAFAVVGAPDGTVTDDTLEEAAARLSTYDVPRQLAEIGWQLARVREIAIHLVLDGTTPAGDVAARAARVVEREMGVMPLLILWQLSLDGQEYPAAPERPAPSGTIRLSPLNERGFRLPVIHGLASACADLLLAFLVTPLRDTLEWISAQEGEMMAPTVSLGLRLLHWSPDAERALLAQRWVWEAIAGWCRPTEEPVPESNWFLHRQLSPADLPAPAPPFPLHWRGDRPWSMAEAYSELQNEPLPEVEPDLVDRVLVQPVRQQLRAAYRALLDGDPVGALPRTVVFLTSVAHSLDDLAAQLGEQHAVQDQAARDWHAVAAEAATELDTLLKGWPPPRWWWPLRWPRCVVHYWRIQRTAAAWVHALNEARRWMHMADYTARLIAGYESVQPDVCRLIGTTEELATLLDEWRARLGTPPPDRWRDSFYRQATDSVTAVAREAARAIGGLAQLSTTLDERLLDRLLDTAHERMAGVEDVTFTEIVHFRHRGETVQAWWEHMWESAAPLWRADAQPDIPAVGAVACAGSHALAETLTDVDDTPVRWIEIADPRTLYLLRARKIS